MQKYIILFAISFMMVGPAYADSYSMKDLKILISQNEFVEALRHLKDISPSARNAEWKDLAVQTILGRATAIQKDSCRQANDFIKQVSIDFASVSSDERLKKKQKEIVECYAEHAMSQEERDQASKEALESDANSIVFLVTEGGHTESDPRAFQWILDHPEKAKSNEKLKKYAFKAAGERMPKETSEIAQLKMKALKKAGWYDDWIAEKAKEILSYAHEMMKGVFDHEQKGRMLIKLLDDVKVTPQTETAVFFAPLSLMSGGLHSGDDFERFKTFSSADRKNADAELTRSRPDQGFWLSGAAWNSGELFALKANLPKTYQMAQDECAAYRKKHDTEPAHVSSPSCEWLK